MNVGRKRIGKILPTFGEAIRGTTPVAMVKNHALENKKLLIGGMCQVFLSYELSYIPTSGSEQTMKWVHMHLNMRADGLSCTFLYNCKPLIWLNG